MREGWESVELGEVLTEVARPVRVADLDVVNYAGVRWYAGGVYAREQVPAAAVKGARVSELREGDIVYNRMWATKASFGIARADVDGCHVTNDFPIFRPKDDRLLVEYLGLLFTNPGFQEDAAARAKGTTERRRLNQKDFLNMSVVLPPAPQQRRIVDLVAAVDDAIEVSGELSEASAALLDGYLDSLRHEQHRKLGALSDVRSGASWSAANGQTTPSPDHRPVLTIVNTRPDGTIDLRERTYVKGLTPAVATLTEHSLVMVRTNGNRSRIGNVYRPGSDNIGDAVSAFQFIVEPKDPSDRAFIYWMIRRPACQAVISAAASGSTGLGNIAASWLRELELPWPDADDRVVFTSHCEAMFEFSAESRAHTAALRDLRSNLLTALLSGEHDIPESYDRLLEEVAA